MEEPGFAGVSGNDTEVLLDMGLASSGGNWNDVSACSALLFAFIEGCSDPAETVVVAATRAAEAEAAVLLAGRGCTGVDLQWRRRVRGSASAAASVSATDLLRMLSQ